MTPSEDDTTVTPPHGDPLRGGTRGDEPASRHGVQLDQRGEPQNAADAPHDGTPSTPRTSAERGDTP